MRQVGGNHYENMAIQPWEIIEQNGLDFWEGNALKYLLRHRDKNGSEDLKKAIHYIQYLIDRAEDDRTPVSYADSLSSGAVDQPEYDDPFDLFDSIGSTSVHVPNKEE